MELGHTDVTTEDIDRLIKIVDTDNNGTLEYQEFVTVLYLFVTVLYLVLYYFPIKGRNIASILEMAQDIFHSQEQVVVG